MTGTFDAATRWLLDQLPVPVCIKARDDTFLYANKAFATLLGQPLEKIVGKPVLDVVSASAASRSAHSDSFLTPENPEREVIATNIRKDGSENIVQVRKRLIEIPGQGYCVMCTLNDISQFVLYEKELEEKHRELRRQQGKLKELASIDPLTGIFNRRAFYDKSEEIIRYAEVGELDVGVLMFDLDKFKNLNDTFGHATGDEVLIHFTRIVTDCIRTSDIFARLGGEEFGLLLPDTDAKATLVIAERIRQRVERTAAQFNCRSLNYTTSVGATMWMPSEARIDPSLSRADTLLYQAKQAGKNSVCFALSVDDHIVTQAQHALRA